MFTGKACDNMKTLEQFKVEQMKDKEFATEYEKICLELENEKTEIQAEKALKVMMNHEFSAFLLQTT